MIYNTKKTDKVTELRWNLYSRNQAEGENLPPTKGALLEHIKRSHFVSLIYKRNLVSIQNLPRPEDYGWTFNEILGIYEPVMTLSLPAPAAIMELVKCNCKKGCSKRCSCRKVSLNCTEICGCSDFECTNCNISLSNSKNIIVLYLKLIYYCLCFKITLIHLSNASFVSITYVWIFST